MQAKSYVNLDDDTKYPGNLYEITLPKAYKQSIKNNDGYVNVIIGIVWSSYCLPSFMIQ